MPEIMRTDMDFKEKSVKRQLFQEGLAPKKSLGQNFLIDNSVLSDIVAAAELSADSCVLEIGPGMGVLTKELSREAERVVAVEIDRDMVAVLGQNLSDCQNVTVINQDILKVDLEALFDEHFGARPVKVIANLPYYITTPIIMKLLESPRITEIVVMIQKEVALRLAAKEGTKDFGAISLAVQYRSEPQMVRHVPPEAFCPPPKVTSSVIRLVRREKPPVTVKDETHFFNLIKAAFSQRRKTFLNSVGNFPGLTATKEDVRTVLGEMGISETIRGEALSMAQFAEISDRLLEK